MVKNEFICAGEMAKNFLKKGSNILKVVETYSMEAIEQDMGVV